MLQHGRSVHCDKAQGTVMGVSRSLRTREAFKCWSSPQSDTHDLSPEPLLFTANGCPCLSASNSASVLLPKQYWKEGIWSCQIYVGSA